MKATARSIFLSRFMMWVVIACVGSYFLVSVDTRKLTEHGLSTKGILSAFSMPRLKLGIDLQGGTYLVLGVGVDKAVENRLANESKMLDELFENKGMTPPAKKEMAGLAIKMEYADNQAAKIGYNFIRNEMKSLSAVVKGNMVTAVLAPVEEQRIRTGSVEQGVSVLDNRLNGFGVSGLIVQRHGDRQIVVQLPGLDDPERVKAVITKTAHLEFKIVKKTASSKDALLDDFDGDLPSDLEIVPGRSKSGLGDGKPTEWYLVSAVADVTGDHITDARMNVDQFGHPEIAFNLDNSGGRKFGQATGDNIGRSLGIIIDDVMYADPRIDTKITNNGRITGRYTVEEARDLALVLRSGSLLAPLSFEQESRIGSSLGQDSIRKGVTACLIGLLLLFFFSLLYYKLCGLFAMMALCYNLFAILLFLSYFEATLTLPGIAGMVLTTGMAIDASILIYERIKELLAQGDPLRKAINEGFSGAMVVILDSNITTFLTGLILFKFGGPAIKGFAITLMAGIIATIIAGVYFLKSLFDFVLDNVSSKLIKF